MDGGRDEQRVYWHSRRGMLELDLVLMPFARQVYPGLDEAGRAAYRRLLECEDAELYAWLMRRTRPDEPELRAILERIFEANGRAVTEGSD